MWGDIQMACIRVNNLSYRYPTSGTMNLKKINFSVEEGEFIAVIGRNGSGKTTLCNVLRGFAPHFYNGEICGEVFVNGKDVLNTDISQLVLDIGYVFQNPFTQMSGTKSTVFEEIGFGLENVGVERDEIIDRVRRIIETLGIESIQFKSPMELSGGQCQRVALASVIVMEPSVLVIDEPTSQLDPEGTRQVFEIIAHLKRLKKTVILIEHKIDLIAEYADRVVLMDDGKIVMDGSTYDVLTSPRMIEYNTSIPQYARLGMRLRDMGYDIGRIPVNLDEAVEVVEKLLKRGA